MNIGITGATGNIGAIAARALINGLLLSEGAADSQAGGASTMLRLFSRRPETLAEEYGAPRDGLEFAELDFRRPDPSVLADLDVVLFVSATETEDRAEVQEGFVEALRAAAVKHVVYTSFAGASATATFTYARVHYATEEAIKASGMGYTFLRDNFYLDVLPLYADHNGVISGPAGDGAVAAVAREDVADVATTILRALANGQRSLGDSQTYTLSGPEALTLSEVAHILSEVTGRTYSYHDQTVEQARQSRLSYNPEPWQMDGWISTYTAIAAGELSEVTADVERILGRKPTDLAHVVAQ